MAMDIFRLDSVIFHSAQLVKVRAFYQEVLQLPVNRMEFEGAGRDDASESYVNFRCGETLLCLEAGATSDRGSVVLLTRSLAAARRHLELRGVALKRSSAEWLMFEDPEGRTIILQEKS